MYVYSVHVRIHVYVHVRTYVNNMHIQSTTAQVSTADGVGQYIYCTLNVSLAPIPLEAQGGVVPVVGINTCTYT